MANLFAQATGSFDASSGSGSFPSPFQIEHNGKMPTPGGPLTGLRINEIGVIKMNDYLSNGKRATFWEEHFVKIIMHVSILGKPF